MTFRDWASVPAMRCRPGAVWRRIEFWLILIGCLIGTGLFWFSAEPVADLLARAAQARTALLDFGPLAPLIYVAFFALQILFAPLPGQFLGVMSGYVFGPVWGSLYSVLGLVLGAGLALWIARRFGRRLLARFLSDATVRTWERKLRMRSPVTWGLLFLFPVPDVIFYIAGLSRVPLRHLLLAAIAGRSVGLVSANLVGNWSASMSPEWVMVKWVVLGMAALLFYRYQRSIRLGVLVAVRRIQRTVRRWRGRRAALGGVLP